MDNEIGIMKGGFEDRGEIDKRKSQCIQRILCFPGMLCRVDSDGIADISKANPDLARFADPAINKSALRLTDGQIDVRAMLQDLSRGKVARIDQEDLAIMKIWLDVPDQIFMVIGLDQNEYQIAFADAGEVPGNVAYFDRCRFFLFANFYHTAIFQKGIEILIVHGMGCFDQCHLMAPTAQVRSDRCPAVACT